MVSMKNTKEKATLKAKPARGSQSELAQKIASFLGKEENLTTEIPGVSLHQRTAPTPPCRMTYHPGVIVVAQGSKRVNLGRTSFTYDESRFVVTAVDLPIVSWVAEATEEVPCLALSIKLDMSMVRKMLTRARKFMSRRRLLIVPRYRLARLRRNSSTHAAAWWICWIGRRTFLS